MTDHVPTPEDDEDDNRGLPLFWGLLLVGAVTAIAVWLFATFPTDAATPRSSTPTTLAEAPVDTTTATTEASAAAGTIVDVLAADGRVFVLLGILEGSGRTAEL